MDALRVWGHHLMGTRHQVKIISDYQNLEFFQQRRQLLQRQVRWALELSEYDFIISHHPRQRNRRAEALSRHPDL